MSEMLPQPQPQGRTSLQVWTGGASPPRRGPRLQTLQDLAAFQSKLIREVYAGRLNPDAACKLGFLCNGLRATLEVVEVEALCHAIFKLYEKRGLPPENEHSEALKKFFKRKARAIY